jgi:GNAT superfamily N-acetyltransferase
VPENSSPLDTPEVRIREHIASNPPFAPTIPIYLRAAIQKDVPAIAQIYNQWIRNSTILEDNIDVSEEDINRLLLNARDCNQPFIVAINRENVPDITSEGTPADPFRFQNQGENIIGFSRAISSQGINGRMDGQSRFTVKVEVFVHQEYLHKGVGSCLMDAIMCCLCPNNPSYNGYRFLLVNLNSYDNNHEIYCKTGGEKKYHQVLIERSFEKFNDQNFVWISKFLRKFGFSEFYRAIGVRHVDQNDKIRFLDVVTFHREARPSIGFAH